MSDFLRRIRELTEKRNKDAKIREPHLAEPDRATHDFASKLSRREGLLPRVIAEVKLASPSEGAIAPNLDPVDVARGYLNEGAAVISVLTEPEYFGGSLETLKEIRKEFPDAVLLMKDFIIDEYQLRQARSAGADAVLLMISLLSEDEFKFLYEKALDLDLTPLVEVHDERELEFALAQKAAVIGINNRDLRTLRVSLDVSRRLSQMMNFAGYSPVFISESGIQSRREIDELTKLGFDAFLIGSSLMKIQRPSGALRKLIRPLEVKICGITSSQDAQLAVKAGATMLGFIFAPASPRRTQIATTKEIVDSLPAHILAVGVFTSETGILEAVEKTGIQGVQFHNFEPSAEILEKLRHLTLIRAFEIDDSLTESEVQRSKVNLILLDQSKTAPTALAQPEFVRGLIEKQEVFIAGGLTPENVESVLRRHSPRGIDLARGVETSPGMKSAAKLTQLFEAIERSYQ